MASNTHNTPVSLRKQIPLLLILALYCVSMQSTLLRVCITVLAPDIESSMGISAMQVSFLASAVLLGSGCMQIPAGILTDRLGGIKVITLFLGVIGIASFVLSFTETLHVAVAARFMTGLAIASFPATVSIISRCVPAEVFARAIALCMSFSAIGGILGNAPLALLSKAIGWRSSMFVIGCFSFILLVVIYFAGKPLVARSRAHKSAQADKKSGAGIWRDIKTVIADKRLWPIIVWQMCTPGTFFILGAAWWVKYMMATSGISQIEAANIILVTAVVGVFFIPAVAAFSDKIKSRKKVLIAASILAFSASLSQIFLAGKLGMTGMTIQALLFSFGTTSASPCLAATIKETFPHHLVGTASGCAGMLYPIFAALATMLFGVLVTFKTGQLQAVPGAALQAVNFGAYRFACWLLVATSAISFCAALFIKESYTGRAAQTL